MLETNALIRVIFKKERPLGGFLYRIREGRKHLSSVVIEISNPSGEKKREFECVWSCKTTFWISCQLPRLHTPFAILKHSYCMCLWWRKQTDVYGTCRRRGNHFSLFSLKGKNNLIKKGQSMHWLNLRLKDGRGVWESIEILEGLSLYICVRQLNSTVQPIYQNLDHRYLVQSFE